MKLYAIIVLVFACVEAFASDEKKNLGVEFTQVTSGHFLQRDTDDRLYSAIIWDAEGYRKFLKRYRLPVDGLKLAFLDTHVFVVGFSDNLQEAFCDGVSHKSHPDSNFYYFDFHDTGLKFKRRKPADGMKYSCWVLVRIPRPDTIAHIQVREGIGGGLSEQFGNPANQKAEPGGAGQRATRSESQ